MMFYIVCLSFTLIGAGLILWGCFSSKYQDLLLSLGVCIFACTLFVGWLVWGTLTSAKEENYFYPVSHSMLMGERLNVVFLGSDLKERVASTEDFNVIRQTNKPLLVREEILYNYYGSVVLRNTTVVLAKTN